VRQLSEPIRREKHRHAVLWTNRLGGGGEEEVEGGGAGAAEVDAAERALEKVADIGAGGPVQRLVGGGAPHDVPAQHLRLVHDHHLAPRGHGGGLDHDGHHNFSPRNSGLH